MHFSQLQPTEGNQMSQEIDLRKVEAILYAGLIHQAGGIDKAKALYLQAKEALKPEAPVLPINMKL
jgi:hypothetical protein